MDEKKAFPMPSKSMIDETRGGIGVESDFFQTICNEDGTVAGVFTKVAVDEDGNFVGELDGQALAKYAQGVLAGDEDTKGLLIGATIDGEDAMDKANDEADRLNSEFAPPAEAADEDKAKAVVDAKAAGIEEPEESEEEYPEEDYSDIEDEPILDQLNRGM